MSGPGERYAVGPTKPAEPEPAPAGELPEAYGTERLFLTARDPHWLYAAWDLTSRQRDRYKNASRDGHLLLRIYKGELNGAPHLVIEVGPESKSRFVHVDQAGTRYLAELGYYTTQGDWQNIATSSRTLTPPETISEERAVEFATIPPEVTLKKVFQAVQQAVSEHAPLGEVLQDLRQGGWKQLPKVIPPSVPAWTPRQARALAELIRVDPARRVWMGSLEITELVRRHLEQEVSSAAVAAQPPGPGKPEGAPPGALPVAVVSSPAGGVAQAVPKGRRFSLTVNAELVLYGATEPQARVAIGGRQIRLRADGTFSYRFSLPDGSYPLSIAASTADGAERRVAHLHFSRSTVREGEVGAHTVRPDLKPPLATNVA